MPCAGCSRGGGICWHGSCSARECDGRACSRVWRLVDYCVHLGGGVAARLCGRQRQRAAGRALLLLALRLLRPAWLPLALVLATVLPLLLRLLLLLRAADRRHSAVWRALTVASATTSPAPTRPESLHGRVDIAPVDPMQTSAQHDHQEQNALGYLPVMCTGDLGYAQAQYAGTAVGTPGHRAQKKVLQYRTGTVLNGLSSLCWDCGTPLAAVAAAAAAPAPAAALPTAGAAVTRGARLLLLLLVLVLLRVGVVATAARPRVPVLGLYIQPCAIRTQEC
jgi:hypothetical protein